ncbi:hypothetical protein B0H66DRAFT_616849 [Apodospora peruviana]|uniref:Uncharacterized protein n=1 Tax=Apodospora peruviana TaxID=516989 RepID=A0AAE0MBF3_9PEZI|nr:hypothetical protein B0H66DRAFT_616849 [Apodospora peruviana]
MPCRPVSWFVSSPHRRRFASLRTPWEAIMDYDAQEAKRLLQVRRELLDDEANSSCFGCLPFCSGFSAEFAYEEVNHVLGNVVDTDGPVGVVRALLALGADVNFERRPSTGFWSVITRSQQAPRRSGILVRAVIRCRPETVRILARQADQETLESALRQALSRRDLAVMKALFDHGGPAIPSPLLLDAALGKAQSLMGDKDTQTVREVIAICLKSGSDGPSTILLSTDGVVRAVRARHTQLLDTILRYRRPTGEHETMALVEAVRTEQTDILSILLRHQQSARSLTRAISQALKINNHQVRFDIIQLLVKGGAQEGCTADAFACIVQSMIAADEHPESQFKGSVKTDMQLFHLLLDEGMADVDYRDAQALQLAVQAFRPDLVSDIVARQPSANSLGLAIPWAMQIPNEQGKYAMMKLLLRYQLNEDAVGQALVETFKTGPRNKNLIKLLLTRASVNYKDGEVFIYTIRRNFRSDLLHLLLEQGTSYKALFTAVREALNAPKAPRRVMFGALINRMEVDHLNTALKHVILEEQTDLCLVGALLDAGAHPTYEDGVCIRNAAYRLHYNALRLLSEHLTPAGSQNKAEIFTQALALVVNRGVQWIAHEHVELVKLLLRFGASSEAVSKAMVQAVDRLAGGTEAQTGLLDTLLGLLFDAGADVNHESGRAVGIAAGRGDTALVNRLLGHVSTSSATPVSKKRFSEVLGVPEKDLEMDDDNEEEDMEMKEMEAAGVSRGSRGVWPPPGRRIPETPDDVGAGLPRSFSDDWKQVRTHRGDVIGRVDLGELRRWQTQRST